MAGLSSSFSDLLDSISLWSREPTKESVKAERLHLRDWQPHQTAGFYYRAVSGGFELRTETFLASLWPPVDLCESPIEIRYYAAIVGRDLLGFKMLMQQEVTASALYRLDFAFLHPDGRKLCVEVDGHDYHERTKEQARSDRQRDRRLMLDGWRVLRYTGSEVWGDAVACAHDTIAHLKALRL
jgi:very-short-patch-repair endonuclease